MLPRMAGRGETGSRRRRSWLIGPAVALTALIGAPAALAHIERASYWPDPGPDTADGVPTGGAVPEVRSLFTALDEGPVGETRVVCETGEPIPRVAGAGAKRRPDVEVSREWLKRVKKKKRRLVRKLKKAESAGEVQKLRKRVKRMKKKVRKARRAYERALDAELDAREQGEAAFKRALARDKALREDYEARLAADPSMQRLDAALEEAVDEGYVVRPSEGPIQITQAEADKLREFNARLLAECAYDEIQPAINDSGNNDRVVVMPGIYTEPTARSQPTDDPRCDEWEEVNDRPGDGEGGLQTGANTYTYIFNCPNDQNLIAVLGREPNHDALPPTPREDRHGIPDEGPCIRCNLQLEGSGVSPDDVVVEAGDPDKGDGNDPDPDHENKDVGIRADRADGFVLRNLKVRHVREHAIYVHEVDGYVNDRFKTAYAHEYGTLQFTSDHGVIEDCDTFGSGDAGVYPGSAPDTGEQGAQEKGTAERFNTVVRRCDMHHNAAGYSGTAANAVHLYENDFYDNALGFTTDVFTAAGHPGFPQDSDRLEDNEFYSNNFNPYLPYCETSDYEPGTCSDIDPTIPVPVGTGMWIAGGNDNEVRRNHFWDNWRRGAMLFTVPDAFVCGPGPTAGGNQQHGCDATKVSTSYRNEFYENVMGRSPDRAVNPTWPGGADEVDPNGLDFWWDQFLGTQPPPNGNCWYDNVGPDGSRESLEATPPINPLAADVSVPGFLPEDCATSVGTTGVSQEAELITCLAEFDQGVDGPCTWFETPADPATQP